MKLTIRYAAVVCALGLVWGCAGQTDQVAIPPGPEKPHYDHVFRGGKIIDGTGNAWRYGDVAVAGDRIACVGELDDDGFTAGRVHDLRGQVIAPGFIDVHAHADTKLYELPLAENFIRNGVTTIVTGNCGSSVSDVGEYFRRLEADGVSLNVATLYGHNTVLREIKGNVAGKLTPEQMAQAEAMVDDAMRDGAVGLSTGLIYTPGEWSETEEIIALQRVARQHGGIYVTHMRSEADAIVAAIEEALRIGRETGSRVQVSHFKVNSDFRERIGGSDTTLGMIDAARAAGQEVWLDQYPYAASSTGLSTLLPGWMKEKGPEQLQAYLADDGAIDRGLADMHQRYVVERRRESMDYVVIASCRAYPRLSRKNLVEVTKLLALRDADGALPAELPAAGDLPDVSMEDQFEAVFELTRHGGASCVFHSMAEQDVDNIMRHPLVAVCSDSGVRAFGVGHPHPRGYGANARVLGEYVRDRGHLGLEEAVRKMTSLPATAFRFDDRGLIRVGLVADLVVFDPETIQDHATFAEPHQYSTGFAMVMVNGEPVVVDDTVLGALPGRPLRGPGAE